MNQEIDGGSSMALKDSQNANYEPLLISDILRRHAYTTSSDSMQNRRVPYLILEQDS